MGSVLVIFIVFCVEFLDLLVCFVLCLVYPTLPVFLDCSFMIAPSVFCNAYFVPTVCPVSCVTNVSSISRLSILDCRSVFSNVYLLPVVCPVSLVPNVVSVSGLSILDCRSVFSDLYLLPVVCPVSSVPNVVSVSGLSILDCPFGIL